MKARTSSFRPEAARTPARCPAELCITLARPCVSRLFCCCWLWFLQIRNRLEAGRHTCRLFDTQQWVRDMEVTSIKKVLQHHDRSTTMTYDCRPWSASSFDLSGAAVTLPARSFPLIGPPERGKPGGWSVFFLCQTPAFILSAGALGDVVVARSSEAAAFDASCSRLTCLISLCSCRRLGVSHEVRSALLPLARSSL